jgi:hypothetical protein
MSDHPSTTRAGHYAPSGGQPVFSRTLLKQTRAWLKSREKEAQAREAKTAETHKGEA